MFYENQIASQKADYKNMLSIVGGLTQLFSESNCPYLSYRAHENIFCKYFQAENLARMDCSADAKKNRIGIGLKTWMGNDDQKVAEFGKLRTTFDGLSGINLVRRIAEYRNARIRTTKNMNGIDEMIYHIVKRIPGAMQIYECPFDYIDIDNLTIIPKRGNANNTYFSDGRHTYHFSTSKNTLYMIFDDMVCLDTFEVEIMNNPYSFLLSLSAETEESPNTEAPEFITHTFVPTAPQLCLRLYSVKTNGEKFVAERSGLNQWNANGRRRDPNEIYIPYQKSDRERMPDFFPPRDTIFNLKLPDGKVISAKVCQEADRNNPLIGKAVMSNPNKVLGEWLLRNVFELPVGTVVTYDMLEKFGIDSVVFTKNGELDYSVDFAKIGTYEDFYEERNH